MNEQPKIEIKEENISELAEFRQEIARLKEKEAKEGITGHFLDLDPKKLEAEDMKMYGMLFDKDRPAEELVKYFQGYHAILKIIEADNSRELFAQYIGNLIQIRLGEEEEK